MRIIKSMVLFVSLMFPASFCLATPPTSMDLTYDLEAGNLHVEAIHPSFNLDKSYVRLMNVYINGTEVSTKDYYRQDDYNKFSDDMPVTAKVGDIIKVELFCSLGGDMSKELTVVKPGTEQPNQGAGISSNNSASS